MSVRVLTAADFVRQPWKNGGGFTTELAAYPPSPPGGEGRDEGEQFLWRVSIAEVETSGPFSDFTGYERTIMLLEGHGMELGFDAREPQRIDQPLRPFVFDGGWETTCRLLSGPVRDMNLMVRRDAAHGTMQATQAGGPIEAGADWTLVYELTSGELRIFEEPDIPALPPQGKGIVVVIRIKRV